MTPSDADKDHVEKTNLLSSHGPSHPVEVITSERKGMVFIANSLAA